MKPTNYEPDPVDAPEPELLGDDPEFPISSRGSAQDVACEVCDAVDHATDAHVEAERTVTA